MVDHAIKSLTAEYSEQFLEYSMLFCLKGLFLSYPKNQREILFNSFIEGFKRTVTTHEQPFMDNLERMEDNDTLRAFTSKVIGDSEDIRRNRDQILNKIEDRFRTLLVESD